MSRAVVNGKDGTAMIVQGGGMETDGRAMHPVMVVGIRDAMAEGPGIESEQSMLSVMHSVAERKNEFFWPVDFNWR